MAKRIIQEVGCGISCQLSKTCKRPFMPPSGDLQAPLLFIGEAPGEEEDATGIQFVGRAGKLLREALANNNLTDFVITNTCICRPPDNMAPTRKQIEACSVNLQDCIKGMPNLKLIVPLGAVALYALTGKKAITKCSGQLIKHNGYDILPIIHPAYVLRNQTESKTFFEHIARIPKALGGNLTSNSDLGIYKVISNIEEWILLRDKLLKSKSFIYDLETNGLFPFIGEPLVKCISFSITPREAYVLPLKDNKPIVEPELVYKDLEKIFRSKRIGKVGQSIKFDNKWMKYVLGIPVNGTIWDTALSAYLLNENEPHGLKHMAWKLTNLGGYENNLSDTPDKVDGPELHLYSNIDADVTNRVYHAHLKEFENEHELRYLMDNLLIPVSDILMDMEIAGIRIDPKLLDESLEKTNIYLDSLSKKIANEPSIKDFENASGTEFNPGSHIQLREVLFKYEGLVPVKFTDKTHSPSTDREVLESFAEDSNLCKLLTEYSLYSSLRSKSIKELYEYKTLDNRIHTTFQLDTTVTGRTSSTEPNMQNIVKGEKDVVGIRNVFIADEDFVLCEIDESQHELRCMAEMAKDYALMEALASGDVHMATTCDVLGKKPEQVTSDERRNVGKCINPKMLVNVEGKFRRIGNEIWNANIYDGETIRNISAWHNMGIKKQHVIVFQKGILVCGEDHWIKLKDGSLKRAKDLERNTDIIFDCPTPILSTTDEFEFYHINPFDLDEKICKIELNEDWAYLAGAFLGDGCFMSDHSAVISSGKGGQYEEWKDILSDHIKKIGLDGRVYTTHHDGNEGYNIYLGSRRVIRFMRDIGLGSMKRKVFNIPDWVFANQKSGFAFIAGLIDTDGFINKCGHVEITTKDPFFASDIAVLCRALGLDISTVIDYNKTYKRYYYGISLLANTRDLLIKHCPIKCPWKKERLIPKVHRGSFKENIVKLNLPYGEENMVDLSIDSNSHLYWVSNAVTHNTLNFGLIYGISAYGIQQKIKIKEGDKVKNIDEATARLYISRFFNKYFRTKDWMDTTAAFIKKHGYIRSLTGRYRRFPVWDEMTDKLIREGINFPIQNLASEILLYSLIGVNKFLKENNLKSFLVLEIHDSLMLNIHKSEMDILPAINNIMVNYFRQFIPFESETKVDFKIGPSWGQMREYKI